ncbi:hypothetical protein ACIRQP_03575 [Streptomyces sp. NPDC102274]|uniref:hypothetical protein n=1 Tax=Streptomyces sp. NPDC102274 TaxID=3366151 RepID=UPI0037FD02F6
MTAPAQVLDLASAPNDRPVRDSDPARNAAYWARIDRLVAAAPPLSDDQRARLRAIFHQAPNSDAAGGATPTASSEHVNETAAKQIGTNSMRTVRGATDNAHPMGGAA